MLACSPGPTGVPSFPLLVTPKIDGIRALMVGGALVSRTLKPIPNLVVRTALESVLPDGCDGELMYGDSFQSCTSAVMTRAGPQTGFTYHAFDYVCSPATPYAARISQLTSIFGQAAFKKALEKSKKVVTLVVLKPVSVSDQTSLDAFEAKMLSSGYEGVIARLPHGRYKFGRSTPGEGLMLKIKRFEDAEARVTGVEELVHEGSDGHSNQLGALLLETTDGVSFRVGTGFTIAQRKALWMQRRTLHGRWVKYKFFRIGTAVAPRFPTFLGFRDARDM